MLMYLFYSFSLLMNENQKTLIYFDFNKFGGRYKHATLTQFSIRSLCLYIAIYLFLTWIMLDTIFKIIERDLSEIVTVTDVVRECE